MTRPPCIYHSTSQPYRFFGREAELALLDHAYEGSEPRVVAFVGPGGQGKTAIVQQWLEGFSNGRRHAEGVFLWSFYRGKDTDLCLRELYAYAEGLAPAPDVSATYCVDRLLPVLRRERWALVLDGTEVVQHESGAWFGRFVHPELGRLLEELASEPLPGVVVLTSRFPLPELERRKHVRVIGLGGLDPVSARGLLGSLGVRGTDTELEAAASGCGFHAKAVELLGTYLRRFQHGEARRWRESVQAWARESAGPDDDEQKVARVLSAFQTRLAQEAQDILALATAFREPPIEGCLQEYLLSSPVQTLLQQTWGRKYTPFAERPAGWLAGQVQELIDLRLLERVAPPHPPGPPLPQRGEGGVRDVAPKGLLPSPLGGGGVGGEGDSAVIDAHPLVRRAFEHVLGSGGRRQSALARAGFLHGRPDRRKPATLEEAREEVELFHAHCDAGLWNEADGTYVALDNPKHRFLAPALERDLLLRFFPEGDWRKPSLWPGFGRYRSLAICFEMLGSFEEAIAAYRESDAALRGDALIALARLEPLLKQAEAARPWQTLWRAYRAHALCLAGQTEEAVALARSLVPLDVYEWVHVFECLLRAGQLAAVDLRSVLYRPPLTTEHRWAELARQRMRADYQRVTGNAKAMDLDAEYQHIMEAYDRGGLPYERALTRLSYVRWLLCRGELEGAQSVNRVTLELAKRHDMRIMEADAWQIAVEIGQEREARENVERLRRETGYRGADRP